LQHAATTAALKPLYGTDPEILETAIAWLGQGAQPLLVTVARTWGSSPRPVGSLMLIRDDGAFSGSVSGGCVEADLVMRYRERQLGDTLPTRIDYGINREEATRLGLPCGGRLELLLEQLESAVPVQRLLAQIRAGELVTRRVYLATGEVSLHAAAPTDVLRYNDDYLEKVFGPQWRLLLIGSGELTRYVAQIALLLNYQVIICDPREDREAVAPPSPCEFVHMMPDDAVQYYALHPRCAVVTLSHDPKLDDLALLDALGSPAFYVGALGSQRNSVLRRERLLGLGLSTQQLQRLHAPAGLPIGSHTPAEIAVSILAGITAARNLDPQAAAADSSAA
jgi:xanthine dehydrogenase accessory factor